MLLIINTLIKTALLAMHRGRELGPSGHEAAGAPDAVPPLAPTMSTIPRGRRGTPQLYAHPSGGTSHQLSPFALAREPDVPATRFYAFYGSANPTPVPWLACDNAKASENPHFRPLL